MNPYWQFSKFLKVNESFLEEQKELIEIYRLKRKRRTAISIAIVSVAVIIPFITSIFSFISLLNIVSVWLIFQNLRSSKEYYLRNKSFLVSYEEAIHTWKETPQKHPELTYEEILDRCQAEMSQLIADENTNNNKNNNKKEPLS